MEVRARPLVALGVIGTGLLAAFALFGSAGPDQAIGVRVGAIIVGLVAVTACVRIARAGLFLKPYCVTIRSLTTTERFPRADVLGLGVEPVGRGRLRRLVVVRADGRVTPAPWTLGRLTDAGWAREAAWAAYGFGPTQPAVATALQEQGRAAGTEVLPVVTPDPGLTPQTVSAPTAAGHPARWLGWETTFVVIAFALPGVAAAVEILAQHLDGVSDLNEFALPLPHSPAASLFILLLGYLTTALVVPIALLLLARTGQPPASLGLHRDGLRRDAGGALGLLGGVWVVNIVLLVPLSYLIDNKHLTNTATNSHVPAYYVVYALVVSATTAINEEVIVNGYFLTRLSQMGWSPRAALILSLAVRTSYHAYYGVGLIATVPFGYLVTRSFQKRRRLARPILTHFAYDAILLIVAVLTS